MLSYKNILNKGGFKKLIKPKSTKNHESLKSKHRENVMKGRVQREMDWVTNLFVIFSLMCLGFAIFCRVTHKPNINSDIFYSLAFLCTTVTVFFFRKYIRRLEKENKELREEVDEVQRETLTVQESYQQEP